MLGANGHAVNGRISPSSAHHLRQAEEFELEGLVSDDEEATLNPDADSDSRDSGTGRKKERRN